MENIQKVSDTVISAEKVIPEKREKIQYDIKFLNEQRKAIQAQKDRDNALRDAELAEIDELIKGAESLGVKSAIL